MKFTDRYDSRAARFAFGLRGKRDSLLNRVIMRKLRVAVC